MSKLSTLNLKQWYNLKEASVELRLRFNLNFGPNNISSILKEAEVIDEYNSVKDAYQNSGYFREDDVEISNRKTGQYLKQVVSIRFTEKGLLFLKDFLPNKEHLLKEKRKREREIRKLNEEHMLTRIIR